MIVNTGVGPRPLRGGPVAFQRMIHGGQALPRRGDTGVSGFGIIRKLSPVVSRVKATPTYAQRYRSGYDGFGAFMNRRQAARVAMAHQRGMNGFGVLPPRRSRVVATPTYAQRYRSGYDGFGVFPPMRRTAPLPLRQRGSFMPPRGGFNAFPDTQARYLAGFGAFPYLFHGFGDDDVEEMTPPTDPGTEVTVDSGPSTVSMIDSILSSGAKLGQAYTSYLTRNKPTTAARTGVAVVASSGMPVWVWAVGGVAILGGAYLLLKK
jgi:hypothetical protein